MAQTARTPAYIRSGSAALPDDAEGADRQDQEEHCREGDPDGEAVVGAGCLHGLLLGDRSSVRVGAQQAPAAGQQRCDGPGREGEP